MLRAGWYVLTTAIWIATVSAIPVITQVAAGGQPQLKGSARLTGRVVAADDARPVRRAYLTVFRLPTSEDGPNAVSVSRHLETNGEGRFEVIGLPSGSYHIRVDPQSGFVGLSRPREVKLSDGQVLETTIRLTRTGAIVGRVLDEGGEAVVGAQVHAVRRSEVGGDVTLSYLGRAATANDRGTYRLYGLAPGDYYLVASFKPVQRVDAVDLQRSGFADTYYPNSSTSRSARSVAVRAGQDTEDVNFTLTAQRLARVTVNAVNAEGVPVGRAAQMMLWRRDDVFIHTATHNVRRQGDGTFVFQDVPPGEYRLLVKTSFQSQEAAYLDVTVGKEDVSLNVRTNVGARVSGRVLIDGQPAGTGANASIPNVSVAARPPPRQYGYSYAEMQVANLRGTDRFDLTGLRGPTILTAEVTGGAPLSIRRAGEEIAGEILELVGTETIENVIVEFTTKIAAVAITVTGTSPSDEPEPVVVVLFAEEPSLWRIGHVQYARTYARRGSKEDESQTITLSRMPAGRYLVAAVHDPDESNFTPTPVLETLRKQATPVTLVAGQTAKVAVRVTSMPR